MARFYGLPKVHKPRVPLRPIVSLRDTPTLGLSKWLYQRPSFLAKDSPWTVKLAEDFLKCSQDLDVKADEVVVSFDEIPPTLAINTISSVRAEERDTNGLPFVWAHCRSSSAEARTASLQLGGSEKGPKTDGERDNIAGARIVRRLNNYYILN
ncbi:unnamed protein product [Dibothriocephalus latus]|uniref:Uncharacterized protein n=1 Tax=Dibothriocephalus latus TaxID=60516 RepID=A0A3P6RZK9_DIBLA|nr:unnamed protein product [Dibothriocephalus latus]